MSDTPTGEQPVRRPQELDAWLNVQEEPYDWLIPGLIERQDRLILTGTEGHGKSTLLRQFGIQAACGLHPFGGPDFEPLRTLILDLENSDRQLRRWVRPLRIAAGDRYAGSLFVETLAGLDLLDLDDRARLFEIVKSVDPDLLVTGPSYKMVGGNPVEEGPAALVAGCLDRIRHEHGCAILLEAHSPHAGNGGRRPMRPYGASLWLRWPEFGLYLGPHDELVHWRGQRDVRDWPSALKRGGAWPFTLQERKYETEWRRIEAACAAAGRQLSDRELSDKLKISKTTVLRVRQEHQAEWNAIPQQLALDDADDESGEQWWQK